MVEEISTSDKLDESIEKNKERVETMEENIDDKKEVAVEDKISNDKPKAEIYSLNRNILKNTITTIIIIALIIVAGYYIYQYINTEEVSTDNPLISEYNGFVIEDRNSDYKIYKKEYPGYIVSKYHPEELKNLSMKEWAYGARLNKIEYAILVFNPNKKEWSQDALFGAVPLIDFFKNTGRNSFAAYSEANEKEPNATLFSCENNTKNTAIIFYEENADKLEITYDANSCIIIRGKDTGDLEKASFKLLMYLYGVYGFSGEESEAEQVGTRVDLNEDTVLTGSLEEDVAPEDNVSVNTTNNVTDENISINTTEVSTSETNVSNTTVI
jgi:hypothetical protein